MDVVPFMVVHQKTARLSLTKTHLKWDMSQWKKVVISYEKKFN